MRCFRQSSQGLTPSTCSMKSAPNMVARAASVSASTMRAGVAQAGIPFAAFETRMLSLMTSPTCRSRQLRRKNETNDDECQNDNHEPAEIAVEQRARLIAEAIQQGGEDEEPCAACNDGQSHE